MNDRPKVLIFDRFHHKVNILAKQSDSVLFERCSGLDEVKKTSDQPISGVILRTSSKVDEKFLEFFPDLKVLVTATSGFDHLNLKLLNEKGIVAGFVPDAPVDSVSELVLLKLLSAVRKQKQVYRQMTGNKSWDRSGLVGNLLRGRNLGIIGYGRIGRRVAQWAPGLGLEVFAYDPHLDGEIDGATRMGFDELLRSCDILTFHVPKTGKTRHMLNRSTLESVSSQAIIINTSRGDVINTMDLVDFLVENPESMASLDVFEQEPLAKDSRLYSVPNLDLSPHIGATTDECLYQSSFQAMTAVCDFFASGQVPQPLPPPVPWWEDVKL